MPNDKVKIQPGTKEFKALAFKVSGAINTNSLQVFNYKDGSFQNVEMNVYAMPAYVPDDKPIKIFFVLSRLIQNQWVISFVKADVKANHEVVGMSKPMTTGEGLTLISKYSQGSANRILHYFNTLEVTNHGEWKVVKR